MSKYCKKCGFEICRHGCTIYAGIIVCDCDNNNIFGFEVMGRESLSEKDIKTKEEKNV